MSASVYSIVAKGVTVVGANTMVYLRPNAAPVKILRCHISQGAAAATSEQQAASLFTVTGTFPTLVTATPFQHGGVNDSASSIVGGTSGAIGTCGINASAEGGTKIFGPGGGFNNLNCWEWVSTPDEQIIVPAASAAGFGIFLVTVPTAKTLWYSYITYAEIG